jgi:RHS repeat-associated protein
LDEYVFLGGRRIARRTSAGAVYYFLSDQLGSSRVVTNATGSVAEDSDYYPFGGELAFTDTLDNNYKFIGHERDTESGLDYYKFRMLSSRIGRWTTADPVMATPARPQTLNRYGYVSDNPANLTDRLGAFIDIGGRGIGIHIDDRMCDRVGGIVIEDFVSADTFCLITPFGDPGDLPPLWGGGGGLTCGPGTRRDDQRHPPLCNEGDQFAQEWECSAGCTEEECNSMAAEYSLECNRRSKNHYALCSKFSGFGWSIYCHCCIDIKKGRTRPLRP